MSVKDNYNDLSSLRERLLELLYHHLHCHEYKKRTEILVDVVKQIESEGKFPKANYSFDSGVMSLELTKLIEINGKHWVTESAKSRNIMWAGNYQRVDIVAKELKENHPESFLYYEVKQRNKEKKEYWAFTKVVRIKKYGKKRLVIAHEKEDLSDEPRFFLTSAKHWEVKRILETWSYRWPVEIFHEFEKEHLGFESAQVRNEEGVKRHASLCCVLQSLIQRVKCSKSKSERYSFAKGNATFGQQIDKVAREVIFSLLSLAEKNFKEGMTANQFMEAFMPG